MIEPVWVSKDRPHRSLLMISTAVKRTLKTWLDAAGGFIYPETCQLCLNERAGPDEGYVGTQCRLQTGGVKYLEPPWCDCCGLPYHGAITSEFVCANCDGLQLAFDHARAAVVASDLILDVIHRYKYRQALWFEPFLSGLLLQKATPTLSSEEWDMIVPVPLHPLKQRERGFNQAARLGRRLSKAAGIPLNARIVRRVEPTNTQTMLSRTERTRNVAGAFAVAPQTRLDGLRIVLVDDVLTTGATASDCARATREAGAARVLVWTVARGA